MSDTSSNPLSGPIDDEPDKATTAPSEPEKSTGDDDGSEWLPEPKPAEGEGPLP